MPARTLILGDVHGCLAELDALLAKLERTPRDRLVLVGDLVAKGPESVGVIRRLRELSAESVLGNHDANLLRARDAEPSELSVDLARIVRDMREDDWAWLEALPLTIALPEHDAIVVHAGLAPGVPIAAQRPGDMISMRSIRPDGSVSKRLEDGVPWASRWIGPPHVYFGHDAVRGLQRERFATGLDTGCVYGKQLTACVLAKDAPPELVAVDAAHVYSEPGKKRPA